MTLIFLYKPINYGVASLLCGVTCLDTMYMYNIRVETTAYSFLLSSILASRTVFSCMNGCMPTSFAYNSCQSLIHICFALPPSSFLYILCWSFTGFWNWSILLMCWKSIFAVCSCLAQVSCSPGHVVPCQRYLEPLWLGYLRIKVGLHNNWAISILIFF